MKNYETILFDLDGTLTDPKEGIIKSIEYALRKMGLIEMEESELLPFIGPPIQQSFSEVCGMNKNEVARAVHFYREYFTENGMIENKVYSGIPQLLNELKEAGKKLFVATSKPTVFAKEILKFFQLDHYFIEIVGSNLDGTRINKKEIIEWICQKYLQFSDGEVVMVGDRSHDIIGANLNGIESIGVMYGYGTKEELEQVNASYVVGTVEELRTILRIESTVKIL
ncbi:HAD family hydrolase [Bacillus sp. JJ664]